MINLEKISESLTNSIGSPVSIILHTFFFIGIFLLRLVGYTTENILLILTTVVSLEAIYLSIFIQMSVNKTKKSLTDVEKDIDDIQEDVEDIQEDMEDIQEDVEDLAEDQDDEEQDDDEIIKAIKDIETRLVKLHSDVIEINKKNSSTNTKEK